LKLVNAKGEAKLDRFAFHTLGFGPTYQRIGQAENAVQQGRA
jgi:hypothetical protein